MILLNEDTGSPALLASDYSKKMMSMTRRGIKPGTESNLVPNLPWVSPETAPHCALQSIRISSSYNGSHP